MMDINTTTQQIKGGQWEDTAIGHSTKCAPQKDTAMYRALYAAPLGKGLGSVNTPPPNSSSIRHESRFLK